MSSPETASHTASDATFRRLRSVLIAPGNDAALIAKLPRSGPDAVILDLEDGVPATDEAKTLARQVTRDSVGTLNRSHPELPLFVRVNPAASRWFEDDLRGALTPDLSGIVLPKLETPAQLQQTLTALHAQGLGHLGIIAGLESAAGVEDARTLLNSGPLLAAYFGAEDFTSDMGGERSEGDLEVLYARSRVALAARLAGVRALDMVVTALRDDDVFRRSAQAGRALGYHGKICIHPAQVPLANAAFSASGPTLERARRLLETAALAARAGRGVIEFDGQMIDEPMLKKARATLAAAGESP